jgi:hypothetical protein
VSAVTANLDAESQVLGSMLTTEAAVEAVIATGLTPADFSHRQRHGWVYEACLELHDNGKPVELLHVADLLQDRGRLDAVGGKDALLRHAATVWAPGNAAHYAELVKKARNGGPRSTDGARLLIDMEEAMRLAEEPIEYPIHPLAARGFLTVLVGRHSAQKSWLMTIAGYVAHRGGGGLSGLRCEPTTTLYVDAENGPRLMGRHFRDAGIPADGLLVADGTQLRLPRDLGLVRADIEATGAGLVVLDSLRRLTPRSRENESDDMAVVIAELATLARDLYAAVVLIHHRSTKKDSAEVRGSSSIEDQADLVFALERVDGDQDRQRRRLRTIKYRIDEEPAPIWLRMGMFGGCFGIDDADPHDGQGTGRPRERDRLRDVVLAQLDGKPKSARGIAKAVNSNDQTVGRLLKDLEADELVEHQADGWVRHKSISLGEQSCVAPDEEAS